MSWLNLSNSNSHIKHLEMLEKPSECEHRTNRKRKPSTAEFLVLNPRITWIQCQAMLSGRVEHCIRTKIRNQVKETISMQTLRQLGSSSWVGSVRYFFFPFLPWIQLSYLGHILGTSSSTIYNTHATHKSISPSWRECGHKKSSELMWENSKYPDIRHSLGGRARWKNTRGLRTQGTWGKPHVSEEKDPKKEILEMPTAKWEWSDAWQWHDVQTEDGQKW